MHGVSLAGLVLLGSATWSLGRERPGSPPPVQSVPSLAVPQGSDPAQARELESLRLRLKELEARLQAATVLGTSSPGQPDLASAVLAALDDPRVVRKVQELAGKSMEQSMMGSAVDMPGGFSTLTDPMKTLALQDAQKTMLDEILASSQKTTTEIMNRLHNEQTTLEDVNAAIRRHREEVDARARAMLTAEQAKKYDDMRKPMGIAMRLGGKGGLTRQGIDGLGQVTELNPAESSSLGMDIETFIHRIRTPDPEGVPGR
jgi:hypothetical protein